MKLGKGLILALCLSAAVNTSVHGEVNLVHMLYAGVLGVGYCVVTTTIQMKQLHVLSRGYPEGKGKEVDGTLKKQVESQQHIITALRQVVARQQAALYKKQEEIRANDKTTG